MPLHCAKTVRTCGVLAALAIGACDAESPSEPVAEPGETAGGKADGSAALIDGTPDAIGVMALLNDAATTHDTLDIDAALDRRAATSIIEYRAGEDGEYTGGTHDDRIFATVAELDDLYFVGASAMSRLLAHATANGYVPSGGDLLGVWDNVAFTVDEANGALSWVNTSSADDLDAELDARAVQSIVDARPLDSIQELSGLYFVGQSAMLIAREHSLTVPAPCLHNSECPGILMCVGKPDDAGFSRCLISQDIPGQGESCAALGECQDNLVCSGFTVFGTGECRPAWMADDWSSEPNAPLPAAGDSATFTVDIAGLASVPEDIIVSVDFDGADPAALRLVLSDPNGTESPIWDGPSAGGAALPDELLALEGISRDDEVNGTWSLRVDNPGGTAGTLVSFNVYVSSRFD
ncbi:MAG: hypothetical protein AAF721_17510 [Myxococcota bacterium]